MGGSEAKSLIILVLEATVVARAGRIGYLFELDIGREGPTGNVPAGYAGFI
jgi:hypothetical protein